MGNQFCACDQAPPTSHNFDLPTSPKYYSSRIGERRALTEQVEKKIPTQLALNHALEKLKAEMIQRTEPLRGRMEQSFELPPARKHSPSAVRLSETPIQNESSSCIERRSDLTANASIALDRDLLSQAETSEVLWEGSLLKFKPGLSANFIQRWCQLTHSSFRYYKNQWCARVWEGKPLFVASLSLVQEARRYRPTNEEKQNLFGNSYQFLFEIVLTEQGVRALTPERSKEPSGPGSGAKKSRHRWSARAADWDSQHLLFSGKSLEDCSQWLSAFSVCKRSL